MILKKTDRCEDCSIASRRKTQPVQPSISPVALPGRLRKQSRVRVMSSRETAESYRKDYEGFPCKLTNQAVQSVAKLRRQMNKQQLPFPTLARSHKNGVAFLLARRC